MARILCTHPNASHSINGIKFERDERGQMLSEDIPMDKAAGFSKMPGFKVIKTASDRAENAAPDNMVKIDGPAGELFVGGNVSDADVAALRAHWEQGAIEAPVSDGARWNSSDMGMSPTLAEGQPMGGGLNGSMEGTATGLPLIPAALPLRHPPATGDHTTGTAPKLPIITSALPPERSTGEESDDKAADAPLSLSPRRGRAPSA